MKSCVYPGSFDPVTKGHIDLIRRASEIFDRVTVTVMVNIRKPGALSSAVRVSLLKKACAGMKNVRIDQWDGLLADYMRINKEHTVIRGVRTADDFENEKQSASLNQMLNRRIDTVLLPSRSEYEMISSSAVREILRFDGDISGMVPEEITEEIRSLLSNE